MGGCNHNDKTRICVLCKIDANVCCGPDHECSECNYVMCTSCYDEGEYKNTCVVCDGIVVPNKTLLKYLLKKYGLTREQVKKEYLKNRK